MTLPSFGQPIARIDIDLADVLDVNIAAPVAGDILIYDGDSWDNQPVSGDITITAAGVTAISPGVIVDAGISATAEIAVSKLADGDARQVINTDAAGTGVGWFTPTFDGIVDAGGDGHWTTLQDGDDALDGGPYTMWVKQGTYAAGLIVSTNNVRIVVEPGAVIEDTILCSGDNITLELGAGCDIQGLITMSGLNWTVICQNGVTTVGIAGSGNFGYHNGGGWATIHDGGVANDGVELLGTDSIVENCAGQTTPGGASSELAFRSVGIRNTFKNCKVIDSDVNGIGLLGAENKAIGCEILNADNDGINIGDSRCHATENYIIAAGDDGIATTLSGDNSVINDNIVKDPGANPIDIDIASENCVVVGNRTDGAVVDNSGTSTVGLNDETAF